MTLTDPAPHVLDAPDASDVVTGSVGGARLRDPASSGLEGADLDRLPVIDTVADDPRLLPRSPGSWNPGYDPNAAVRQLDEILQNLATHAAPVLREIAARAAELAARAGEAAGPLAHKAAAVTEDVGARLAAKGLGVAAELRGQPTIERIETPVDAPGEPSAATGPSVAAEQEPRAVEAGLPARS